MKKFQTVLLNPDHEMHENIASAVINLFSETEVNQPSLTFDDICRSFLSIHDELPVTIKGVLDAMVLSRLISEPSPDGYARLFPVAADYRTAAVDDVWDW